MELKEHIEQKLDKLGAAIDAKLHEATEAQKANLTGAIDSLKQSEIKALTEQYAELQKQLDAIDTKTNRIIGGDPKAAKSMTALLSEEIEKSAMFKAFREGNAKSFEAKFDNAGLFLKAGDMVSGNTYTGEVTPPQRVPGIIFDPDRPVHVRDFIAQASTTADRIYYIRESAYDDGTNTRGEGSTKPQSDFDLTQEEAPVRKIASYIRLSKEMLDDTPGLVGYINARMPKKVRLKEDQQILYGNGTAPNLEGITVAAAAYTDAGLADANVNRYDVLVNAIKQVRREEYMANAIMLHPDDWYNMLLTKDAEGAYVFPESARFGGVPPLVAGVPLIANTAVTAGDFLVGDFALGVQLFDRMQSTVRFYEQDQDNAIKNLVTVVAEERLALPIYRPTAFIYGNFASALAQGSA